MVLEKVLEFDFDNGQEPCNRHLWTFV